MSNNYIYPDDKFKIQLDLEVSVNFVGMWKGVSKDLLETRYKEMLESGELESLLKDHILLELHCKEFDINDPALFDRLSFETKEFEDE